MQIWMPSSSSLLVLKEGVSEWAHNVHIFVGLQSLARVQKLPMHILWEVELLHQLHAIGSAQKYLRMGSGGNPSSQNCSCNTKCKPGYINFNAVIINTHSVGMAMSVTSLRVGGVRIEGYP